VAIHVPLTALPLSTVNKKSFEEYKDHLLLTKNKPLRFTADSFARTTTNVTSCPYIGVMEFDNEPITAAYQTFQGPWEGRTKIAIGIDIGTTQSGVAFSYLIEGMLY
jgi:hypothetical protein